MLPIIFFGSLSGLALGLTGGGGSVIAVPMLLYGAGLSVHQAITFSLFSVFFTALFGAIKHWRRAELCFTTGAFMIAGGLIGAPIGTLVANIFSPSVLTMLFAMMISFIGYKMWNKSGKQPDKSYLNNNGNQRHKLRLLFTGSLTGVLTGLFGVGGGFLIVPALLAFTKMPIRQTMGTSLFVISTTCLISLISHLIKEPNLDLKLAGYFTLGSLFGLFAGFKIALYISANTLQKIVAMLLTLLGVIMLSHTALSLLMIF